MYECIIKEFFANAFMEDDQISYWVRGKEFTVSRESVEELLEIRLMTLDTSLHYDKRKEKLEPLVQVLEVNLRRRPWTRLTSLLR